MGYRTVQHVPLTRTYEEALKVFKASVPIRGRSVETRPLGQRRDADTYWVRMKGEDVQYMCYKTPVVTFKPDNSVVIKTDGWSSVSTHQFIWHVLGVGATGKNNRTMLHIEKEKYVLPKDGHVVLKWDDAGLGNWCVLSRPQLTGLRVNRRAANNVRARYKAFDEYLKGFLKLRDNGEGYLRMTALELGDAVGYTTSKVPTYAIANRTMGTALNRYRTGMQVNEFINMTEWALIYKEPFTATERVTRKRVLSDMQAMMLSNDHKEFYKAAMLLTACNTYNVIAYIEDNAWYEAISEVTTIYKHMLTKLHADEILERIDLPAGSVPNHQYEQWLTLLGEGEKK